MRLLTRGSTFSTKHATIVVIGSNTVPVLGSGILVLRHQRAPEIREGGLPADLERVSNLVSLLFALGFQGSGTRSDYHVSLSTASTTKSTGTRCVGTRIPGFLITLNVRAIVCGQIAFPGVPGFLDGCPACASIHSFTPHSRALKISTRVDLKTQML